MGIQPDSLGGIKRSLSALDKDEITEILLRMAKYKKENKELLSYLLYSRFQIPQFILDVKYELELLFEQMNNGTVYYTGKGLRKILKFANKQIRFSADKSVEAEVLIHYCSLMNQKVLQARNSTVLYNLYQKQVERATKAVQTMHPEVRRDYQGQLSQLAL